MDSDETRRSLIAAELAGREAETSKRVELGQQVMYMALVLSVGIVSVGLQPRTPPTVLLMYPFLAMFLTLAWLYHFTVVAQNGRFMGEVESRLGVEGWEHFRKQEEEPTWLSRRLAVGATAGFVLSTQVIVLALGLSKGSLSIVDWAITGLDVVAIAVTTVVLVRRAMRLPLGAAALRAGYYWLAGHIHQWILRRTGRVREPSPTRPVSREDSH